MASESIMLLVGFVDRKDNIYNAAALPYYRSHFTGLCRGGKYLEAILALGFEKGMVKDIIDRVDRNEYKRRQSPPGIKITPRALG
jgi:hypothetical protein